MIKWVFKNCKSPQPQEVFGHTGINVWLLRLMSRVLCKLAILRKISNLPVLCAVLITSVCFEGVKDSEDEEEENNTSPVKRPASLMSGKKPALVATSVCSLNSLSFRSAFNSEGKLS